MARLFMFALACVLIFATAQAEDFYRWTDADGVTHYSNAPPPDGAGVQRLDIDLPPPTSSLPRKGLSPEQRDTKVVIYTTEWCGVCRRAKRYMRERQIPFTEYDVEKSARGKRDYKRMGAKGVPVILIGNQRMNGFDEVRFAAMLK